MTRYLLEDSREGTSDLWGQRGRHDARISLLAMDDVGMDSEKTCGGSANKEDTESRGRRILYRVNGEQRRADGRRGKDRGRASDEPASLTCRAHLPAPACYGPCLCTSVLDCLFRPLLLTFLFQVSSNISSRACFCFSLCLALYIITLLENLVPTSCFRLSEPLNTSSHAATACPPSIRHCSQEWRPMHTITHVSRLQLKRQLLSCDAHHAMP